MMRAYAGRAPKSIPRVAEAASRYSVPLVWIAQIRRRTNILTHPWRWAERERDLLIAYQHLTAHKVA